MNKMFNLVVNAEQRIAWHAVECLRLGSGRVCVCVNVKQAVFSSLSVNNVVFVFV